VTDEATRGLQREGALGDPEARAKVLWERVRRGALTLEQLDLAASLGDADAKAARPEAAPLEWVYDIFAAGQYVEGTTDSMSAAIVMATEILGREGLARVAADWAENSLPDWADWDPPGSTELWAGWAPSPRPQEAIAAARAWAACPSSERSRAAEAAADAAELAAEDAYVAVNRVLTASPMTAADADRVAWCARFSSAALAAWNVGYTAVEDSVADAVSAARGAAYRAWNSARDPNAESEWQRLQLAARLLESVAR